MKLLVVIMLYCGVATAQVVNINNGQFYTHIPSRWLSGGVYWSGYESLTNRHYADGFRPAPAALKYLVIYPDRVEEMGQAQKDAVDAAEVQAAQDAYAALMLTPKPPMVSFAEGKYRAIWAAVFPDDPDGFRTAIRENVAIAFAQRSELNASLNAISYPFERAFNTIYDWWVGVSGNTAFHPYPWTEE